MSRTSRLVGAMAALLLGACGGEGRTYQNSDLVLAPQYAAKEMCSCLFVMEQTEDHCRNWTRASPAVATSRIDFERKSVEAAAILFWGARARFVGEDFGCVLE